MREWCPLRSRRAGRQSPRRLEESWNSIPPRTLPPPFEKTATKWLASQENRQLGTRSLALCLHETDRGANCRPANHVDRVAYLAPDAAALLPYPVCCRAYRFRLDCNTTAAPASSKPQAFESAMRKYDHQIGMPQYGATCGLLDLLVDLGRIELRPHGCKFSDKSRYS